MAIREETYFANAEKNLDNDKIQLDFETVRIIGIWLENYLISTRLVTLAQKLAGSIATCCYATWSSNIKSSMNANQSTCVIDTKCVKYDCETYSAYDT